MEYKLDSLEQNKKELLNIAIKTIDHFINQLRKNGKINHDEYERWEKQAYDLLNERNKIRFHNLKMYGMYDLLTDFDVPF